MYIISQLINLCVCCCMLLVVLVVTAVIVKVFIDNNKKNSKTPDAKGDKPEFEDAEYREVK